MDEKILQKLKKIKVVITDVDGVLTDGGLYYSEDGLIIKKFNVKDGMGTRLLREAGIESGIISTDTSKIIVKRAERLKIDFSYTGIWGKEETMREICYERNIGPENIAFIGDDINDLGIIAEAGFTACPSDSVDEVLEAVDMVLTKKGGEGVFREFAELILKAQSENGNKK